MIRARTKSADETHALATELASLARGGDVILLCGELGAGKTVFVQGLARGLGIEGPVTSPSFTLVRTYDGRIPLVHVDVYRLDHLQEFVDLGIAELLDGTAVTAVEWGDVVAPALPADFVELRIEYAPADEERVIYVRTVGASWAARAVALERALARWLDDGSDSC